MPRTHFRRQDEFTVLRDGGQTNTVAPRRRLVEPGGWLQAEEVEVPVPAFQLCFVPEAGEGGRVPGVLSVIARSASNLYF